MELILKQYTPDQVSKASKTKIIAFDVDGVMTGGEIIYSNEGDELKQFNVKDGLIIKHLKHYGILTGVITGRTSQVVQKRCEELKLDFFYQGVRDKWAILEKEINKRGLNYHEACFIGDDLIDLKSLIRVGLGVAPSDAPVYIKDRADLVTFAVGGRGVVREVADLVLASQNVLKQVIDKY